MSPDRRASLIPRSVSIFALLVLLFGGGGFLFKFAEFLRNALSGETVGFALVPVVIYLTVAVGFGALLAWAALSGQFRDIEAPKYRMLEREEEMDRLGL
jgi:nitrogen fixation-related uncharacterized protein